MTLVALDPAKLFALMLAGGTFALVGLWLMLRPREAGAAKLEVFGIKFEASSAGLLVFLIGAFFLALPLVVPERGTDRGAEPGAAQAPAAARPAAAEIPAPAAATGGAEPEAAARHERAALVPPRQRALGTEVEPNDDYDTANQMEVGGSIAGMAAPRTEDWFVLPVEPGRAALHVKVRTIERNWCGIYFYSDQEVALRRESVLPEERTAEQWEVPLDGARAVFLRIANPSGFPCRYEIFTGYAPI